MAFIMEHSCEAIKPELRLFENLPTQSSLEDGYYVEHPAKNSLTDGYIRFYVSGDGADYMDLFKSYIFLEVGIVKEDGTPIGDSDVVAPINLLGQTLFNQVDLKLNDTMVSESNNLYHYRAIIETLLGFGSDAKNSQLGMPLYVKDTAGKVELITAENKGFKKRQSLFSSGKTVQLMARLHSDMFMQNRYLLNAVDINIRMIRNSDGFCLMAAADSKYKLLIKSASFFARKIKVNPSVQMSHVEKLDKEGKVAMYPRCRVETKTFAISTGSLSANKEGLFTGLLPKRIVIGLVKSSAFEGNINENPFNFQHFDLKYCALYLDGKQIPQKAYQPDFTKSLSLRCYNSLFEGTGRLFKDEGIDISRDEYNNGYALLVFDLTPDLSETGCFHLLKKGNIRLELKFATALANPINVIVWSQFDSTVVINRNRSVLAE